MYFTRNTFFVGLMLLVSGPFVMYKICWVSRSVKTAGVACFKGKEISGQIVHEYTVIRYAVQKDSLFMNGNDNLIFAPHTIIPVRYSQTDPADARIDQFIGIWGDTLGYAGAPVLVILIVFLRKDIVGRHTRFKISRSHPFISADWTNSPESVF